MSDDDTLITKLISETYSEDLDNDKPNLVVDLRNYFEKKLNEVDFISIKDYLFQHNLSMSSLFLQANNQCYRLIHNNLVIDFPSNWSIFKEISTENLVYVDQSLDKDFLLDVFLELNGTFFNLALLKDNTDLRLVYLPEESSIDHVQWFRGFFEKKNQDGILNEAA